MISVWPGEVVDAAVAHAADADPVVHAVARRNVAGQQRGARRRAHRRRAEEIVEADAPRGQAVEHRRADLGCRRSPAPMRPGRR